MKMVSFRIQNYRSINDSGWVDIDDIAVIVGKNESGKTSLLKALWKFNPFKPEAYSLDREWPRGKRKDRSLDKPVATVKFEFSAEEKKQIEALHSSAKGVDGAEITKTYEGKYAYSFWPKEPSRESELVKQIEKTFNLIKIDSASQEYKDKFNTEKAATSKQISDKNFIAKETTAILSSFAAKLDNFVNQNEPKDKDVSVQVKQEIKVLTDELNKPTPIQRLSDTVHKWLPTFIYMDDYKIFRGTAQLDQIKQRKDNGSLTDEDKTVICIMEMAGLDLEKEFIKGGQKDREQRILDMNDASQTLTNEIASRWSQKKYEVMFQADGQHFLTFVKDADSRILIPLEERSKGFQWFFSFDMEFMYETDGKFENTIILLDEPGLHLHAAAQRDLLERMKAYAKNNQLIYSTHLPFMIDFKRLDNIWVAEEKDNLGAIVHKDWATADKDARFTLQAALGLSWSQSLFVGQYNLIVEGVTDFWYLKTISTMLEAEGQVGIDEDLVITPAGGASKVAYIGTILHGQSLNVAVLLDSDKEGQIASEQLVNQWILNKNHVLMLGQILNADYQLAIEDLFSEEYYLGFVNQAYAKELGKTKIKLTGNAQKLSIVERVEIVLKEKGVERFNKGRVAKRIMQDLATKKLSDIPSGTTDNFKAVIVAVNKITETWKKTININKIL